MQPSIAAIIPAKTQSRRIHRKNLRLIAGIPMWRRAAETCLAAGCFETIIVSTAGSLPRSEDAPKVEYVERALDDGEAPDVSATEVARVVVREKWPDKWSRPEWICLVQPTSPCLRPESLLAASRLCGEDVEAVIATAADDYEWPCGAFYFFRTYALEQMHDLEFSLREGLDVLWCPLPWDEAVDVDAHGQISLAELILKARET